MGQVIPITGNSDIPGGLRGLADAIDAGEFDGTSCTLVLDGMVFHLGCVDDDRALREGVVNLALGQKMLLEVIE